MITCMTDLQEAVRRGENNWSQRGRVNVKYYVSEALVLFDYKAECQYSNTDWNWFELNSRGLILNFHTGEVMARPFEKFFNYGQRLPSPEAKIVEITDKMDGSLGILYRSRFSHQWKISTRGSLDSDQAKAATQMLDEDYSIPDDADEWTYLFEIIYPENRIVVNYGDRRDLCLIGARHKATGEYKSAHELDKVADRHLFGRPAVYHVVDSAGDLDGMLKLAQTIDANSEGWVVVFDDGQRFKIKGAAYLVAHRLMTQVSGKRVAQAMLDGVLDTYTEGVPDEFLGEIRSHQTAINFFVDGRISYIQEAMRGAPDSAADQKAFALWVKENVPDSRHHSLMFSARAGKELRPIILKQMIANWHEPA